MKNILVTGGAGFIASHTDVVLLENDYGVIAIDNFSNSNMEPIQNVEKITGKKIKFYEGDVRDKDILNKIFDENDIYAVIHFAGLKAVGESCVKPVEYYDNNLISTLVLIEVMRAHNCKNLVFSSSATVYGTMSPRHERQPDFLDDGRPCGQRQEFHRQRHREAHQAQKLYGAAPEAHG